MIIQGCKDSWFLTVLLNPISGASSTWRLCFKYIRRLFWCIPELGNWWFHSKRAVFIYSFLLDPSSVMGPAWWGWYCGCVWAAKPSAIPEPPFREGSHGPGRGNPAPAPPPVPSLVFGPGLGWEEGDGWLGLWLQLRYPVDSRMWTYSAGSPVPVLNLAEPMSFQILALCFWRGKEASISYWMAGKKEIPFLFRFSFFSYPSTLASLCSYHPNNNIVLSNKLLNNFIST